MINIQMKSVVDIPDAFFQPRPGGTQHRRM